MWLFFVFFVIAMSTGGALWYIWSSNLPYIGSLKEYSPPIITEVYSADGEVVGRFWDEKRIVVPLNQLPKHLILAFIGAEDARFFEHEGVDILSIIRAFFKNVIAGKIEQGGSTITQQVTRSLLLKNPEKTYKRKAREALLSLQIEKSFSKERILFLYLNQIYLGHGAYGVEAAARSYFGKEAKDLNLAESALIAGLPQAPSRYSPVTHFDRAKARQRYVLGRMRKEGFITKDQQQRALATEIVLKEGRENSFEKAPYFAEHVRRYLEAHYGRDVLYRGGLKVYTTLNLAMQRAAQEAMKKGLRELDKREGYRGPLRKVSAEKRAAFKEAAAQHFLQNPPALGKVVQGLVDAVDNVSGEVSVAIGEERGLLSLKDMKWARKPDPEVAFYSKSLKKVGDALQVGDVVSVKLEENSDPPFDCRLSLEQEPLVQGALLSLEARTGRVRAMVGGRDFRASQFNRALQSRRQPGSAFKPIIYASALDNGMTPATVIIDSPYLSTTDPEDEIWRPKNYKKKFFGPTLFRTALIKSRNVITVKILRQIGIPQAIHYARMLGIESDLSADLSLALGSSGLSLLEITRAYSVFANNGMLIEPLLITRIKDRNGRIIEENQPSVKESLSKETAFVMTDILSGVVKEGTGWRVRALKRPTAGKTGTTNDLRDAWFIGYTPKLVTGVWVGYDDRSPMGKGETGSRAASPIWLHYMSEVLKEKPVEDFQVPEGVVFTKIDSKTGLLASPYSKKTVFQAFKEGTEPKEYTPPPKAAKSGHFSQFDKDAF
jgi:penicillin-binding protein 1A